MYENRVHSIGRILTLALLCLGGSAMAADEWGTFRGPRGNGQAIDPLPPGDGVVGLDLAWKRPLGSGYSGISVSGEVLVTAFAAEDAEYVVALGVETGEEIWRHELGPRYEGQDGSYDGPIGTPAIAGGRVFALDPSGRMVALDLADGTELWTVHLVDDLGSERPYYGFAGSPLVVGDTVVLQIGGEAGAVAGFAVDSGELRWRSLADGVAAQSPILAEIGGRRQVLVMGQEKLAGLDPTDGSVLWQLDHGGEGLGTATQSPVPLGGRRFLAKYDTPSTGVFELEEVDGTWKANRLATSPGLTRSYSPATVSGDYVFGFTGRILSAIDPTSGDLLWRTRDVGDGFAIAIGDHLAILEKTGTLHLGRASAEGWTGRAERHLFDDLAWTPPSYAGGSIYVRSLGEIARVDVVREAPEPIAVTAGLTPPQPLAGLAAAVASSSQPETLVDRFLEDRSLPLIDGERVVFLWRGEADDVAVAGDMIGMRREEPMHRLEGTNLWWWETEIDRRARVNYLFFVDLEPRVDPTHERVFTTTILGPDMNWQREEPVEMSWFAMPEWPGRGIEAVARQAAGRLEDVEITVERTAPEGEEELEPAQVPVRLWLPPGYDDGRDRYPVVYVFYLDALDRGGWAETLDRVVGRSVEPLIVAFVELPGGPGLRGSLAGQVVPEIDRRYRTRADRSSRALVGMGFAGYSAAIVAFRHADVFGALGLQSIFLTEGYMERGLRETIGEQTVETTPLRIYMEWGRWDLFSPHEQMDFRYASRWTWNLFRELGYAPLGGEVWDSTDFASWRNRTDVLLRTLFPLDEGADPRSSGWFTGSP